jgi:hypothetical protein
VAEPEDLDLTRAIDDLIVARISQVLHASQNKGDDAYGSIIDRDGEVRTALSTLRRILATLHPDT